MTVEEHLRTMIGDLVFTVAKLSAEVDALRAAAPPASVPATAQAPSADAPDPHVADPGTPAPRDDGSCSNEDHKLPADWKLP